jgi:hypothetical protein
MIRRSLKGGFWLFTGWNDQIDKAKQTRSASAGAEDHGVTQSH